MIGQLQWLVSLGRFDVATAVMTMSRFRSNPRIGHLERLQRIYGYVRNFRHAAIRIRCQTPDYSELKTPDVSWMNTIYGKVKEEIPKDVPDPLGKVVRSSTWVDANLFHDHVTGRAAMGVLHSLNQTPVDWTSKRQATVETATFGSEIVAAKVATEQILDLRMTLRYFGIPIEEKAYMFGDNQSVVTNTTLPHSPLRKRHNALSYHRVREVCACFLNFFWLDGKKNPADQ